MLLGCAGAEPQSAGVSRPVAVPHSLAPTRPTRYIWRNPRPDQNRPAIEWMRLKLSPGTRRSYRFVQGLCAKLGAQPRPYCAGGICDARRCTFKTGAGFRYRFLPNPAAGAEPIMEIRWEGVLTLSQPGPGQGRIQIPAARFPRGIRLNKEDQY